MCVKGCTPSLIFNVDDEMSFGRQNCGHVLPLRNARRISPHTGTSRGNRHSAECAGLDHRDQSGIILDGGVCAGMIDFIPLRVFLLADEALGAVPTRFPPQRYPQQEPAGTIATIRSCQRREGDAFPRPIKVEAWQSKTCQSNSGSRTLTPRQPGRRTRKTTRIPAATLDRQNLRILRSTRELLQRMS